MGVGYTCYSIPADHRATEAARKICVDGRHLVFVDMARRMGTSVQMIDRTYGHLAHDAEDQDGDLLDAYDGRNAVIGHAVAGLLSWSVEPTTMRREKAPHLRGCSGDGRGGFRTCDLSRVKRALSH